MRDASPWSYEGGQVGGPGRDHQGLLTRWVLTTSQVGPRGVMGGAVGSQTRSRHPMEEGSWRCQTRTRHPFLEQARAPGVVRLAPIFKELGHGTHRVVRHARMVH